MNLRFDIQYIYQLLYNLTIETTTTTTNQLDHADDNNMKQNGASKAIINVQYLNSDDINITEGNAHRPSKKYCTYRNVWIKPQDQVLLINHYLGSWEQFNHRNDSRRSYEVCLISSFF